ncbi:MAG: thioredoxin domain-containing protein [Candidatus Magasanikbacteria bacterium]|jgi:protein-disulfide isomerase|nr:thioredoxin domain-containing protein [Candidatus Magasanikbacteria bacterium]
MTQMKKTLLIFLPAIAIIAIAIFIRVVQFQNGSNDRADINTQQGALTIPILADDPIIGNKKAPITIIAFEDLGCSHCAEVDQTFSELTAAYPKQVKIIWKSLTVTRFPHDTRPAHTLSFCANRQRKFEEFKSLAFANYQQLTPFVLEQIINDADLNTPKLERCAGTEEPELYLKKNEAIARSLGIQAVPAIFVDGQQVQSLSTVQEWEQFLGLLN